MKLQLITLSLACIGALTFASCGENKAASTDAATATKEAGDAMKSVDFSKLAPAEMAEKAKSMVADLGTALTNLKDSQGAKDLVAKFQPVVDQLVAAKNSLMAQKFDMSSLKKTVEDVTAKFKDNAEVMGVIQPLIDKLNTLFA